MTTPQIPQRIIDEVSKLPTIYVQGTALSYAAGYFRGYLKKLKAFNDFDDDTNQLMAVEATISEIKYWYS